jgi:heme A synthase
MKLSKKQFIWFAWGVLIYNILVILWGAYVRASGSGAGCGGHWPLCNGVVLPQAPQVATIVELTHRLSSGIVVVLSLIMPIWAWRIFKPGSRIRWTAAAVLFFTVTEALVGAGLVLFNLTGSDESVTRAVVIVIHLVNTFLLLASLALTAYWATYGEPVRFTWNGRPATLLLIAVAGLVILGGSGAITALGDTLFPPASLAQGLQQDTSSTASFLIRLRVYHPVFAVSLALYSGLVFRWLRTQLVRPLLRNLVTALLVLFVIQLMLGGLNVLLLAPIWLQMVHLLVMDTIWIGTVLVFSSSLSCFSV